jgi:hypothetical protein
MKNRRIRLAAQSRVGLVARALGKRKSPAEAGDELRLVFRNLGTLKQSKLFLYPFDSRFLKTSKALFS